MYLIVVTVVGKPRLNYTSAVSKNQTTVTSRCGFENKNYQAALFALEVASVVVCAALCWQNRDVEDARREFKPIITGMC
jgi:hypothetical protein